MSVTQRGPGSRTIKFSAFPHWDLKVAELLDRAVEGLEKAVLGIPHGFFNLLPTRIQAGVSAFAGSLLKGWSPADHVHDVETAAVLSLGEANAEGAGTALARATHVHRLDVRVAKDGVVVGTRKRINLLGGVFVADNPTQDQVDIAIPNSLLLAEAAWRFEEASGVRADSFGRHPLSEFNGTIGNAAGKVGNAVDFVRANGRCLFEPDPTHLVQGAFDYTITTWAYLASKPAAVMYLYAKDGGAAPPDREYGLLWDNTLDRFAVFIGFTDGTILSLADTTALSLATWYFIRHWYDNTAQTLNIQVNDGPINSVSTAGKVPYVSGRDFIYGARRSGSPADFWDGRGDAAHWFKFKLSAADHAFLYNGGSGYEIVPSGLSLAQVRNIATELVA